MIVSPSTYATLTLAVTEPVSVIVTDHENGETHALSGTYIRAWKGRKGITVQAYNSLTGRTETVFHLNTETVQFVGLIFRGNLITGESYVLGNSDFKDVFGQNI